MEDSTSSTCPICKKTFEKVQSLYGHLQVHGLSKSNHKVLNCDKCNSRFDTLSELWKHQRVHEDLHRPFPCQICDKTFERYPFFIPFKRKSLCRLMSTKFFFPPSSKLCCIWPIRTSFNCLPFLEKHHWSCRRRSKQSILLKSSLSIFYPSQNSNGNRKM